MTPHTHSSAIMNHLGSSSSVCGSRLATETLSRTSRCPMSPQRKHKHKHTELNASDFLQVSGLTGGDYVQTFNQRKGPSGKRSSLLCAAWRVCFLRMTQKPLDNRHIHTQAEHLLASLRLQEANQGYSWSSFMSSCWAVKASPVNNSFLLLNSISLVHFRR